MDTTAAATGHELNLLLRGGTVLLLVLLAASIWRSSAREAHALRDASPRSAAARLGAAFAVGVAAATLISAPGFAGWAVFWRLPISALAAGNMFVFWLFTRALLDDEFAFKPWQAGVWLALAALGVSSCLRLAAPGSAVADTLDALMAISPIAWALLAVLQSLASWREDLVEGRRRLRGLIVVLTAAYTVGQWLVAWLMNVPLRSVIESAGNAAGTAALAGYFAWHLLQWRAGSLFEGSIDVGVSANSETNADANANAADGDGDGDGANAPALTLAHPNASARTIDPRDPPDPRQVATLERLLVEQRIYREPNLTVAALALRMGLQEHRLRRLINQGLGHRHFSAFLNGYRIADAQRALRDPALADTPILTIAMDVGFQSIGPFNRAFKAATGLTPSEYRRAPADVSSPLAQPPRIQTLADSRHG